MQFAVLYLTSKNDHKLLELLLKSDAASKKRASWEAKDSEREEKNNPILVSVQQDYKKCTKILYQHGYRIPLTLEDTGDGSLPGQDEEKRFALVTKPPREKDQVQKLMIFKAYANPYYVSLAFSEDLRFKLVDKMNSSEEPLDDEMITDLQRLDPLRRTLKLAEEAEALSNNLDGMNELKNDYKEIKEELEAFSYDILTACSNMDEAKIILEHNPRDDDDDVDDEETENWQKALFEGRKKFVSHPLYQQNFRSNMSVDAKLSNSVGEIIWCRTRWNLKYVPYSLLISLFYPIVVLLDFTRDADLLFVSPAALKQRKKNQRRSRTGEEDPGDLEENRFWSFFRNAVHTPIFRMISTHFYQVVYLVLLMVMIWHRPISSPVEEKDLLEETIYYYVRMVVTVFALTLLVDDVATLFRRRRQFFESFWNTYSLLTNLLMLTGLLTQLGLEVYLDTLGEEDMDEDDRPNLSGNDPMSVAVTLYAIAVGLEFFKLLRYLLFFDYLGPVVICVTSVFKDVILVLAVYVIIFFAHFVTLWTLYKPYKTSDEIAQLNSTSRPKFRLVKDELSKRSKMLTSMFWRIVFADDADSADIESTNATDNNISSAFSHSMGRVVWGLYQIIVTILMLNILIAIMNTTYAKVWTNFDQEWKSQRTYYQV